MARTLTDASGREYSASILDPAIVKRDRVVRNVMKRAQRLHTSITTEKERMSAEVEKYLDDLAKHISSPIRAIYRRWVMRSVRRSYKKLGSELRKNIDINTQSIKNEISLAVKREHDE